MEEVLIFDGSGTEVHVVIIVGTAVRKGRGKVVSFSLDRNYVVGAKGRCL